MHYTRDQSSYRACGEDPDADRNQSHPMSPAPEYESSKIYEWTASGAETAASSEKINGYHPPTVLHDQKAPEARLHSEHGDDHAADWQDNHGHAPAISKANIESLLHSLLEHMHDLGRTAKDKCQILLDFLQDSWLLEIGACVMALGLFITEVILLRFFEKHPVGTWPWGWSLNSAVALLTTLIEANLVFALASCLGQMKWLWFSLDQGKMKRLSWVDLIARSNTPLGALSLLLRPTTWRNFFHRPVWSGAFCGIGLLGMGLFSQNVITQKFVKIATQGGGWIYVSREYDDFSVGQTGESLGDQGPTAAMASYGNLGFAYASNVIAGFSSYPYDDNSLQGLAYCDHLNCTYGIFDTLSICPRCADVSHEIVRKSGRYVLQDGELSLDVDNGSINITSGTEFSDWDRLGIKSPGPLLVHYLAMVRDNDLQNTTPAAVECVAYWCAFLNYSEMVNGVLNETRGAYYTFWSAPDAPNFDRNVVTNSSVSARTSYGQEQDIYIRPEACQLNQSTESDAENCTFRVSALAQLGLQNFLTKGWFGMPPLLSGSEERLGPAESDSWQTTSLAANAISFSCSAASDCQGSLVESMKSSFSNLTAFMTNVIRKTPGNGPGFSSGTSSSTVLIYDLRWAWIAYPAAIIALVFGFVGYTVLQSRHTHLWKASILPAVFHSLPDVDPTELPGLASPAMMRKRAEALSTELKVVNDLGAGKARWAWRTE